MWWSVLVAMSVLSDCASAKAVSADQLIHPQPQSNQLIGLCSDVTSFTSCIKMRSLILLNGLTLKDTPIHLFGDALTLVKSADRRQDLGLLPVTMNELDTSLPRDENLKEKVLDELVSSSLSRFVNSRSLQIRLPDLAFWKWSISEEEGRKRKGGGGAAHAFLSMGGMMGAMWLGAIALMAGKALTVSMMALMLAVLASLKKGGGGGDHSTTYEVISVPTGHGHSHHGHHRRSYSDGVQLAYSAHNTSGEGWNPTQISSS